MAKCLVKIKEVLSPYHRDWRGFRILVAHCNMDGHKPFSKESAPSFQGAYLIVQFGDYENVTALDKALEQLPKELLRRKFDQFEIVE